MANWWDEFDSTKSDRPTQKSATGLADLSPQSPSFDSIVAKYSPPSPFDAPIAPPAPAPALPDPIQPASTWQTLKDIGGGALETIRGVPAVVGSMMEGVTNPYAERDWKDSVIESGRQRQQTDLQALRDTGEYDRPMGLGMPFTRGEWAETTQSFPYTAATMLPALAGGAVGSALGGALGGLGGPAAPATVPAGVAAGRAIGGTLGGMLGAYLPAGGSAANQFIRDSLDKYRQDFSAKSGREPTPEEIDAYYKATVEPQAGRAYHGESAPEAVGTVAELGLMKSALGDILHGGGSLPVRLAKAGAKTALSAFGVEPATETLTQQIQQPAYAATGLTDEAPRSMTSPDDWLKSAGEVYKQAAATSLFFSALGIPAGAVYGRYQNRREGNAQVSDAEAATADLRANLDLAREPDILEALRGYDTIEQSRNLPKAAAERLNAARQQLMEELQLRASPEALADPISSPRGMAGYLGFAGRANELDDAAVQDAAARPLAADAPPELIDARRQYQQEVRARQELSNAADHFQRNPAAVRGVAKVLDDLASGKPLAKGAHGSMDYNLASLSDDQLTRYQRASDVLLRDHGDALGRARPGVERALGLLGQEAERRAAGERRDPQAIREADVAERVAKTSGKALPKLLAGLSPDALDRMAAGLDARSGLEPGLAETARAIRQRAQQERLSAFNPQGQQQPGIQGLLARLNQQQAPQPPAAPKQVQQENLKREVADLNQQPSQPPGLPSPPAGPVVPNIQNPQSYGQDMLAAALARQQAQQNAAPASTAPAPSLPVPPQWGGPLGTTERPTQAAPSIGPAFEPPALSGEIELGRLLGPRPTPAQQPAPAPSRPQSLGDLLRQPSQLDVVPSAPARAQGPLSPNAIAPQTQAQPPMGLPAGPAGTSRSRTEGAGNPKTYEYGLRARPYGIGTNVPSDFTAIDHDFKDSNRRVRYGKVTYARPLTEEEIASAELVPLPSVTQPNIVEARAEGTGAQQGSELAANKELTPIPKDVIQRIIKNSPIQNIDKYADDVVDKYRFLLEGVISTTETATPSQLADLIAKQYDLNNPNNYIAFSVLKAVDQDRKIIHPRADQTTWRNQRKPRASKKATTESPTPERQPWEMTRTEFIEAVRNGLDFPTIGVNPTPLSQLRGAKDFASLDKKAGDYHEEKTKVAFARGNEVPAKVIADYPDLASAVRGGQTGRETTKTAATQTTQATTPVQATQPREVTIGTNVDLEMNGQKAKGVVLDIKGVSATVRIGNSRNTVPVSILTKSKVQNLPLIPYGGIDGLNYVGDIFSAGSRMATIANALVYQLTGDNPKISTEAIIAIKGMSGKSLWKFLNQVDGRVKVPSQWGDVRRAADKIIEEQSSDSIPSTQPETRREERQAETAPLLKPEQPPAGTGAVEIKIGNPVPEFEISTFLAGKKVRLGNYNAKRIESGINLPEIVGNRNFVVHLDALDARKFRVSDEKTGISITDKPSSTVEEAIYEARKVLQILGKDGFEKQLGNNEKQRTRNKKADAITAQQKAAIKVIYEQYRGDAFGLAGPHNKDARRELHQKLLDGTGKKATIVNSGVTAIRERLLELAGISQQGKAVVTLERELTEWMKSVLAPEPQAAKPAPTQKVVTAAGTEIEVRSEVVELADLIISDSPRFPKELQPRDRSRIASAEQVSSMAARLDPMQLADSRLASDGAPIVGPDGVVESGNGRTLALREVYAQSRLKEKAAAYRAMLQERGFDVSGMKEPVLIRRRVTDMTPAQRKTFTEEANVRNIMGMSPAERALVHAGRLTTGLLDLYRGGDLTTLANGDFVRGFMADVAMNESAEMMGADGRLNQEGIRRIESAILARAYLDADLLGTLLESTDNNIKAIGGALLDSAPGMVQLKSRIEKNLAPAELDITQPIVEAARLVAKARREDVALSDLLSQSDMFGGGIDPTAKRIVRLFFSDADLKRPVSSDKIGYILNTYASQAKAIQRSDPLFPDAPTPTVGDLLKTLEDRNRATTGQQQSSLLGGNPAGASRPPSQPEIQRPGTGPAGEPVGKGESGEGRAVKAKEQWEMTQKEYWRYQESQWFDAIQSALKNGKTLYLRNQQRIVKLSNPSHVKLDSHGTIRVSAYKEGRYEHLTLDQKEELAQQSGFEFQPFDQRLSHQSQVQSALQQGKPVPAEVLADYPDLQASSGSNRQPGKLTDFGEKLVGKRVRSAPSLDQELSDDDIATQPLSKIWPADEIDEIEDPFTAAVAFAARAEVPAKPKTSYKLKRWVDKVKMVRGLAHYMTSGKLTRDEFLEKLNKTSGLRDFISKVLLLEALDRQYWKRIGEVGIYPDAYTFDENGEKISSPTAHVFIDGKSHRFPGVKSVADILEPVVALLDGEQGEKKMQFEIRSSTKSGEIFINKKGDPEYRHLKTFASVKEAREFIKNNHADLVAAWESVKERDNVKETDVRGTENRPRVGADHRKGKNATDAMFMDAFGFRGVEFGNWVSQGKNIKERQGMLDASYDALMDLASLLGIPPKALSLNGSLGLALGSRGKGSASAHFEPGNLVINLTKTRGAGTLAHEWFHALDNYFSRMRDVKTKYSDREHNYITYFPEPVYVHKTKSSGYMTRARLEELHKANPTSDYLNPDNWKIDLNHPQGVRPEVERAFADLVESLDASPMAGRSRNIDRSADGYWSRIIERAARAFENFIIDGMMKKGYHNDYLANVREISDFIRDKGRYPYLLPEELAPVKAAFDNLFVTIKTEPTDKGIRLFSKPSSVAKPTTIAQARSNLKRAVGSDLIDGLEKAGKLVFHESDPTGTGAAGFVDRNGVIHLIPANMDQDAASVLSHEAVHIARDDRFAEGDRNRIRLAHAVLGAVGLRNFIGNPGFTDLVQQVRRMAAEGDKTAQDALAKAKLEAPNHVDEEAVAYLAQYADEKLPLVRRILAAIRAALYRMGIKVQLTPADVRALALSALKNHARQVAKSNATTGQRQEAFSVPDFAPTEADKAEVERQMAAVKEVRDDQGRLLAPNGKPSNLNERQWKQVRTKFFKDWFGDWETDPENASKVVDDNGEPMVVYHGTVRNFKYFDKRKSFDGGFHFGDAASADDRISENGYGYGANVMPAFLSIRNPSNEDDQYSEDRWATTIKQAKREGYDGIVYENEIEGGESLVAFDQNQIKSAIGNAGTFSNRSDRIDYSQPTTTDDAAEQERLWQEFQAVRAQFQAKEAMKTPFRRWFGEGIEGVTARDGKPITLYHGTNNPTFTRWDASRSGQATRQPTAGLGFFMTADRGAAYRFGSNVLELNARINKPYYLTDADLWAIDSTEAAEKLRRKLQAQGYDGAVLAEPGMAPYVIVFNSNQAKFVTNENPTESEDFRYSKPVDSDSSKINSDKVYGDLDAEEFMEMPYINKNASTNIKIEQRDNGVFVLWNDAYGESYRVFENKEIATAFADGVKLTPILPKIENQIPVSDSHKKQEQFERWTERKTKEETTDNVIIGFHFGRETKKFSSDITAFYTKWPESKTRIPNGAYVVIVPKGSFVEYFGSDEFRIPLSNKTKIFKLKPGFLQYKIESYNRYSRPGRPQPRLDSPRMAAKVLGDIGEVRDALKPGESLRAKADPRNFGQMLSDLKSNTRPAWLGLLTRHMQLELAREVLPPAAVSQFDEAAEAMDAYESRMIQSEAFPLAERWQNLMLRAKAQADRLSHLLYLSTWTGVDPRKAAPKGKSAEWTRAKAAYDSMADPEARALYGDVLAFYEGQTKRLFDELQARIGRHSLPEPDRRAMKDMLRKEFERMRLDGPYAPLMRFGDLTVFAEPRTPKEKPVFATFETVQEQRAFADWLTREGYQPQLGVKTDEIAKRAMPSNDMVEKLAAVIDKTAKGPQSQVLKDAMYQLFLRSLPEQSIRKHFMHRRFIPGYSADALRTFATFARRSAKQIARLAHSDRLSDALDDMAASVKSGKLAEPVAAGHLVNELDKTFQWMMNPTTNALSSRLTHLGFLWHLGASPAHFFLNLSQQAQVSLPWLAGELHGKIGGVRVATELAKANRDFIASNPFVAPAKRGQAAIRRRMALEGEFGGDMGRALKLLEQAGKTDKTQTYSLAGLSEEDSWLWSRPYLRKFTQGASWFFHVAEVINREATAIAAYRLGRKAGMGHDAAYDLARRAIDETHFDYSPSNRARFMRGNVAKVLTLFKQYSLNVTWQLGRNLYLMSRGASPEVKAKARTKLLGMLGMTAIMAGAAGLPLYGEIMWLITQAINAGRDDDEPEYDADTELRTILGDALGKTGSTAVRHGLINAFAGVDVSSRVKLDDLWWRSDERDLEGKQLAYAWMEQGLGPVAGLFVRGVSTVDGLYESLVTGENARGASWKAVEGALPKALKDISRSIRYAEEGATTARGATVMPAERFGAMESVGQALGFVPAELAERYDVNRSRQNLADHITRRRRALADMAAMAIQQSDDEAKTAVMDDIAAFNKRYPTVAITGETLQKSLQSRARTLRETEAAGGINVNRKLLPVVMQGD